MSECECEIEQGNDVKTGNLSIPGARRRQEEEMWAKKPLPTLPIAFCAPFSRHPDNGRSGILVILSKVTHQEFSFLLLQDSIESLTTFLFLALREFLAVK